MVGRLGVRKLVLLVCGLLGSQTCMAVIIIEKNVAEPTRGYLVEEDKVRVVVDVLLPNGDTKRKIIPRSGIEDMIRAVSKERLEALRSDRPQDYRDYAEELAGKTNDPDAQRTAIRLYQIAAYLAPNELGRSGLLGMVSLARSPEEERKFRAVAYLMDPAHNRSVLRTASPAKRDDSSRPDAQIRFVRHYLRALREGRISDARSHGRRPEVQAILKEVAPELSKADTTKLKQGEPLPPELLLQVLSAELTLSARNRPLPDSSDEPAVNPSASWGQAIDAKGKPVPVLALEHLTEFDPRECHFRNGKWEK